MIKAHPELTIVDVTTSGYENVWHYEPVMSHSTPEKRTCRKTHLNRIEEAREMVDFAAKKNLYLGCQSQSLFFAARETRARNHEHDGEEADILHQ